MQTPRPGRRSVLLGLTASAAVAGRTCAQSAGAQTILVTETFTTVDGKALLVDIARPVRRLAAAPAIIFIHGGGWTAGNRKVGPDIQNHFARQGFVMFSIDYRLTPSIRFPANLEDVRTGIRWVRQNAKRLGVHPDRLGLWGASAGAHLASLAALVPKDRYRGTDCLGQSDEVACVVDAYGPTAFDLMDRQTADETDQLQAALPGLPQPPPMVARRHDDPVSPESKLIGAPILTAPDQVRAASPLSYVHRGAPPFLILHGMADNSVPHGQSVMLYDALSRAGSEVTLRLIDGLPHSFLNIDNLDSRAGPFNMHVQTTRAPHRTARTVEQANIYDVVLAFFQQHLS